MATKSINITLDERMLAQSDLLVKRGVYPNRSRFIEEAIAIRLKQIDSDFIGEQAKLLDSNESEEWLEGEFELWQ